MKIKQVQWFDDHFYQIGDEYYPSVTTKLQVKAKPFLAKWRGDIGNREADKVMMESSERGSRIHYGWYLMTTGGVVLYNPFQSPNFTESKIREFKEKSEVIVLGNQGEMYDIYKLKRWHEIVNPEVKESELIVYSTKNKDAGQLDKLMYIKEGEYDINGAKPLKLEEGLYVVDLKTGKTVSEDAYLQISAYGSCYMEMTNEKIIGGLIIHTGSTTKKGIEGLATKLRTIDELKVDYSHYRAVAKVYDMTESKSPKIFKFPTLIQL